MAEKNTQRRFAIMGQNTFKIANKIMLNQNICRLLKYQVRDPFNKENYPDVDGGNFVLAGHSGNGYMSFFKNLYKLSTGDYAYVYYYYIQI